MADESMVRNLAAQADAIWPQELPILHRYQLPNDPTILDAGCGTGAASIRLADAFPRARVLGVDIIDAHLDHARSSAAKVGSRVRFEHRDVFALELPDASFDLTVCRHVLHSIPYADRVVAELVRVTRPGGVVHLIAEDYGMIHFPVRRFDPKDMWPSAAILYGASTGTDLLIGRRAPSLLSALGLEGTTVDYVVVDTLRVPRAVFAAVWEAWRDGYVDVVAKVLGIGHEEAMDRWDDQIATLRDPSSYAAWLVPVVSGVVPRGAASRR
jgi:ubiquinone/menaquinone biosynthesis C-methylase UbiE